MSSLGSKEVPGVVGGVVSLCSIRVHWWLDLGFIFYFCLGLSCWDLSFIFYFLFFILFWFWFWGRGFCECWW